MALNQKSYDSKPNSITKTDKETRKSDDLIKRNFTANKSLEKCITNITEINFIAGGRIRSNILKKKCKPILTISYTYEHVLIQPVHKLLI